MPKVRVKMIQVASALAGMDIIPNVTSWFIFLVTQKMFHANPPYFPVKFEPEYSPS